MWKMIKEFTVIVLLMLHVNWKVNLKIKGALS